MRDEHDQWVISVDEMGQVMTRYFKILLISTQGALEPIIDCLNAKLNVMDNQMLLRQVSGEEVRIAVFDMHPDKALGADGLSLRFFQ